MDFLSNDQVRAQPLSSRVAYLKKKLGLNDADIEEAFQRIGDEAAGPFFKAARINSAAKFLADPALKNRPGDQKVKYLKAKLGLDDEEVKVSTVPVEFPANLYYPFVTKQPNFGPCRRRRRK